jgi:hypothetical protein
MICEECGVVNVSPDEGCAWMLPREGFLDGLPAGYKAEVTHYRDEGRCEVRITTPEWVKSIDLKELPRLYVELAAREAVVV